MRPSRYGSVLAILLMAGCQSEEITRLQPAKPALRASLAPPSGAMREQLGRIAIIVVAPTSAVEATSPVKGSGAALGAGAGAGVAAAIGAGLAGSGGGSSGSIAMSDAAIGAGIGLALIPILALGGAIYGAAASHSEAEIAEAQRNLSAALTETDVAHRLRDGVLSKVPVTAGSTMQAIDGNGAEGFDSILELELRSVGFTSTGIYNPDVTTWVFASTRLRRVRDDACLYERLWLYRAPEREYFTLAADHAKLLRDDLEAGADQLAVGMANDLFVATQPAISKPPKPGAARAIAAANYISGCPASNTPLKED